MNEAVMKIDNLRSMLEKAGYETSKHGIVITVWQGMAVNNIKIELAESLNFMVDGKECNLLETVLTVNKLLK